VRAGFRTTASTGSSRLRELVESAKPDVIVLDLQMPGDDGVSALRYLADIRCSAKIFLVTGMDERTIASAEQYGLRRGLSVFGTLQKPFDPDELLARFERAHAAIRPLTPSDLEQAIENGELLVHYQPIIRRFADNTWDVAAVEALLRWRHPLRGTIPPAEYLPLAEESGLIVPIGQRVLETALKQLRTWHLGFARMQGLGMNVNVSARQLARIDFAAFVDQLATASGEAILPFFRTSLGIEDKGSAAGSDPVTAADRAAEAAMEAMTDELERTEALIALATFRARRLLPHGDWRAPLVEAAALLPEPEWRVLLRDTGLVAFALLAKRLWLVIASLLVLTLLLGLQVDARLD